MDASLPERFGVVFTEIIATNKKLQDLGVEARLVVLQAKLQIGTNDQLEELDKMATKAMKGVLCSGETNIRRCKWWNRGFVGRAPCAPTATHWMTASSTSRRCAAPARGAT